MTGGPSSVSLWDRRPDTWPPRSARVCRTRGIRAWASIASSVARTTWALTAWTTCSPAILTSRLARSAAMSSVVSPTAATPSSSATPTTTRAARRSPKARSSSLKPAAHPWVTVRSALARWKYMAPCSSKEIWAPCITRCPPPTATWSPCARPARSASLMP